jgi:hypothetical protein
MTITQGVDHIEAAYMRYSTGTSIVNSYGIVNYRYTGSNWILNITGMMDSTINPSYTWIVRLRFYPNGNTFGYNWVTYTNGYLP